MTTMRDSFVSTASALLDEDPRLAVVLAAISNELFAPAHHRHPDRVINVGIREQLLVGVAAGLAAEGMRPLVHTYAPFLIERPFESLKVDLDHQGLGAVLVSVGASHDTPQYGRSHACPEDVALLDALTGWEIHVPGHPSEVEPLLRLAAAGDHRVYIRLSEATNSEPHANGQTAWTVVRLGTRGTVVAVGPMLDATLAAVHDQDVTVLYATTVRPFDDATLRATLDAPRVVLVEPYLADTSTSATLRALRGIAIQVLGLGVQQVDLHRYGTREDHDRAQGLDAAGLRSRIVDFLEPV